MTWNSIGVNNDINMSEVDIPALATVIGTMITFLITIWIMVIL